jgi:hypothetical protein
LSLERSNTQEVSQWNAAVKQSAWDPDIPRSPEGIGDRRPATRIGIDQIVMVGDRGMISSVQIDAMRNLDAS